MQDEALNGLLNVRIQSYLMPKTSHRFSSPFGESGSGFFFKQFSLI
jgi:hypothetical protein